MGDSVFLCGRITEAKWRNTIVDLCSKGPGVVSPLTTTEGDGIALDPSDWWGMDHDKGWPVIPGAIEGWADYVGPFPILHCSGHCSSNAPPSGWGDDVIRYQGECWHGPDCGCTEYSVRSLVAQANRKAVLTADHVFAYIDSVDCHGSLVELGARLINGGRTEVVFATESVRDALWFLLHFHNSPRPLALLGPVYNDILEAWEKSYTKEAILRHKKLDLSLSKCESPIEISLGKALLSLIPGETLTAQHKVGKYRLDFAYERVRVGIECDGHEHHSSRESRTRDAERDRYLISEGWTVLRATGSEITQDRFGVARQIAKIVKDREDVAR